MALVLECRDAIATVSSALGDELFDCVADALVVGARYPLDIFRYSSTVGMSPCVSTSESIASGIKGFSMADCTVRV